MLPMCMVFWLGRIYRNIWNINDVCFVWFLRYHSYGLLGKMSAWVYEDGLDLGSNSKPFYLPSIKLRINSRTVLHLHVELIWFLMAHRIFK
ncbi:hypothetical protein L6452_00026 [Arctium lappa]|uniref:Uncharacterized protein n=1 Tax=Arctium lappa TaxID=4217 RepID=A0ACB9FCQ4_ARCLA|nr:hypothetical protein L6452_00026 [Arctium lappa]